MTHVTPMMYAHWPVARTPTLLQGSNNDLYLDWIGYCPCKDVFSLVLKNCGDACAVQFSAILNYRRYYICNVAIYCIISCGLAVVIVTKNI